MSLYIPVKDKSGECANAFSQAVYAIQSWISNFSHEFLKKRRSIRRWLNRRGEGKNKRRGRKGKRKGETFRVIIDVISRLLYKDNYESTRRTVHDRNGETIAGEILIVVCSIFCMIVDPVINEYCSDSPCEEKKFCVETFRVETNLRG